MAWEFSPSPICTLSHTQPDIAVEVTYDPGTQDYNITLSRPGVAWPTSPVFAIAFAPNGPTISTTRQVVAGSSLSVTDKGFGNVLNGLQYNSVAIASVGPVQVAFDLSDAAPEVEAFRNCIGTRPVA